MHGHDESFIPEFQAKQMADNAAILQKLANVEASNEAIVARLDKLNGSIAKHEEKIGNILIDMAKRENTCPNSSRVAGRFDEKMTELEKNYEPRLTALEKYINQAKGGWKAITAASVVTAGLVQSLNIAWTYIKK